MDEMLSIGLWLMIAIITINSTLIWVDANSTVFHSGITDNTIFSSLQAQAIDNTQRNNNYASGNVIAIGIQIFLDFSTTFGVILQTLATLYLAWFFVLNLIAASWGAIGSLIVDLFSTVIIVIQFGATAMLLWKMAIAVRGVLPV